MRLGKGKSAAGKPPSRVMVKKAWNKNNNKRWLKPWPWLGTKKVVEDLVAVGDGRKRTAEHTHIQQKSIVTFYYTVRFPFAATGKGHRGSKRNSNKKGAFERPENLHGNERRVTKTWKDFNASVWRADDERSKSSKWDFIELKAVRQRAVCVCVHHGSLFVFVSADYLSGKCHTGRAPNPFLPD